MLEEIGAEAIQRLVVLNKIDRMDATERRRIQNRNPDAVLISAATGENLDLLKQRIAEFFADRFVEVRLLVPHERGAELSALYATGAPVTEREDSEQGVLVRARLPRELLPRFAGFRVDG